MNNLTDWITFEELPLFLNNGLALEVSDGKYINVVDDNEEEI